MRRTNCRIGFDDRLVMLITIPVLSFIIPFVFFGCRFGRYPYFSWDKYVTTFIITTVLWMGDRIIMVWARRRYPKFEDARKRLWMQSTVMLAYTVIGNNLVGTIVDQLLFKQGQNHFMSEILINSNSAAIFCTVMIMAIYESVYYMNELRKSVEETEVLKRENLNAQLDALKTQVNPHFLFNNLNTLISLIPENPDHAVDFVQQLSKLYRHILEVKDEKSIPLKEELDVLRAYAFLLQTRFGDKLDISIRVPEEKLKQRIVPLSLQILMENAIKHNIVSADKPLKIDVFTQNGSLVVNNNLQKKNQLIESTGIGLDNIRNRYKLISEKNLLVQENGSDFTVSIPLLDN